MLRDWRDSYEYIDGKLKPIEDGEKVRVSMLLMDSAKPTYYLSDRKPGGCYCIDTSTPQGKAWEERGARLREAWRTIGVVDEFENRREREPSYSPPLTESRLHNSGIPTTLEARKTSAETERDRAWEENGRRKREAWKNPWTL